MSKFTTVDKIENGAEPNDRDAIVTERQDFTVVVEVEATHTILGVVTREVEIVEARDSKEAADYIRSMYEDDDEDPYQLHSIEVHPATEAEKLLMGVIKRLQQRIWDSVVVDF